MEITEVRVRCIQTEGRMRAIASITLEDAFVIHDIRIIEGNAGLFLAMPSKRTTNGEYRDVAHPINSTIRNKLQNIVLAAYFAEKEKLTEEQQVQL